MVVEIFVHYFVSHQFEFTEYQQVVSVAAGLRHSLVALGKIDVKSPQYLC